MQLLCGEVVAVRGRRAVRLLSGARPCRGAKGAKVRLQRRAAALGGDPAPGGPGD